MKHLKQWVSLSLVLAMVLSLISWLPLPAQAAASDYIATSYPASLRVKTTKITALRDYPATDAPASYTLAADTMLTVKALHQSTAGSYWYEVLYYGMTLYADANAAQLTDHLTGDIAVSDLMSPAALGLGQGFPIGGTVTGKLNKLGKITAAVHYNDKIHAVPAISSQDTVNGYSYTLDSSTLDKNLIFSDLAAGSYTYLLSVEAISYYLENGTLTTSTQTVVLDHKPLIVTNASSPNAVVAKGIDVSYYQGNINWASVASQIDFAILRVGYEYTLDSKFTTYAAGCNANNIPFGVYIYSYAESEAEAIKEAEFVISVLKNYQVDLPVFFDIEDSCQSSLGSAKIQQIVKAFCETIKDAGYEPGLYTFLSWFNSYFYDSYYNSLPKWVAQVDVNRCSYAKGLTMWQYSWTGSFTGISGNVDCNYYYGEFPGKTTDTSYLKNCTYYPSYLDVTTTGEVNMRQYPSTDHTLLTAIPAGEQVTVTGLYKNTYGNYWYEVAYNGVTGYISSDYVRVTGYRYDDLSVTNPTMEDLALNAGYYLKGKLRSQYNSMNRVNARVYAGEDTLATPILSSSDAPTGKTYTLNYSTVCDNMIFSDLDTGYYTYELSADVKNYYISGGTLASQTENVVVWTSPFTVGNATITPPQTVACDHNVITDAAVSPTCTENGLAEGSHCDKCGVVFAEQTILPATGHSYGVTTVAANCQDYEKLLYTCAGCGDSYSVYLHELNSEWSQTKPEGVEDSRLETKTQYRYSDFTTVTSSSPTPEGYTQLSKDWVKSGFINHRYVPSWPSGFDTTNSLYKKYNSAMLIPSTSETSKAEVTSDTITGYIYYHWCRGTYTLGPINRFTSPTKQDPYIAFHAFESTTPPDGMTTAGDSSVTFPNADCCTDSHWYYNVPVYTKTYTLYDARYTYQGWSDWSDWDDTQVTASDTRKVETRTLYRYDSKVLGDHILENGICIICGDTSVCQHPLHGTDGLCSGCGEPVTHTYESGGCIVCGKAMPVPTLKPLYPTLDFVDEVRISVFFSLSDVTGLSGDDMGLLTWTLPQNDGTIENAREIIPGAVADGNVFMVHTGGIPAKKLGDTVYFKIYVKLPDGTYLYSKLLNYSPKTYATGVLNNPNSDPALQALAVSMLNYGTEAQKYFDYKTYALMNADLTESQLALVDSYRSDMMSTVPAVDPNKTGFFAATGGFSRRYPSVTFESAFCIDYFFTPSNPPGATLKLYYWTQEAYDSANALYPGNASGYIYMVADGSGQYTASVTGIAAKELDRPIYVAAGYNSNGSSYCTGVLAYSIGAYCTTHATPGDAMQAFAAATAVYCHQAKAYFYR